MIPDNGKGEGVMFVKLSNGKAFTLEKIEGCKNGVSVNGNFFPGWNSPEAFAEWWRTVLAPGLTLEYRHPEDLARNEDFSNFTLE